MKEYPILVYWSDQGLTWVADVPDLGAFSAHGDSPEEALREILVALDGFVEAVRARGLPLPLPSLRELSRAS